MASILSSIDLVPKVVLPYLKTFLTSLWPWPCSIGSKVSWKQFRAAGAAPLLVGLIAWFCVAGSNLVLQNLVLLISLMILWKEREWEETSFLDKFTWIIPSLKLSSPFLMIGILSVYVAVSRLSPNGVAFLGQQLAWLVWDACCLIVTIFSWNFFRLPFFYTGLALVPPLVFIIPNGSFDWS